MVSVIYSDTVHKGIWLVSANASGSPQLVARNFAFVAAGMYLWEGLQCFMYDLRLLSALVGRAGRLLLRLFCFIDDRRESISLNESSDSKPFSCPASQEYNRCRSPCLDSQVSCILFPVLNVVAQLAYIVLRICTFLALLSILVILNDGPPTPRSACQGWDENSGLSCRTDLVLMLGYSVAPLVTCTCATLFVVLRVVSVWSPCVCEIRMQNSVPGQNTSRQSPGGNSGQESNSFRQLHGSWPIKAFKILALPLHLAQYIWIVLIGLGESSAVAGISGVTGRRTLILVSLVYSVVLDVLAMSLIVFGFMRWRKIGCGRAYTNKDRSEMLRGRSSSPTFAHSCGRPARSDCATEGGVTSYGTLSDMSFAQKSNICSSDNEETDSDSELSAEGGRLGVDDMRGRISPRSSTDRKSIDIDGSSRNQIGRVSPLPGLPGKTGYCRRESKTDTTRSSRSGAVGGSRRTYSDQSGQIAGVWTALLNEGRYQGLPWILGFLLMKISMLICVVLDFYVEGGTMSTLGFSMRFFSVSLAIMTIASGRLFLLMTRASPIGDGYMEAMDPPPPWSPSASLLDVGLMTPPVADDRTRRPSLSYQAKPATLVRLDVLPSYVERRLYTRRVRHEMEAAAGGALRTIGGSVVLPLPPPMLAPERSKRTQEKRKDDVGGIANQTPDERAGMSGMTPNSGPERTGSFFMIR